MSQDNNLGTSNLCTTEDAFEQFQAVAMYEEDEYITLSDIVPPQPVVPDLSNELNEIPYDNEVVLSSQNDDAPIINSTVESSSGHGKEPGMQPLDISENIVVDGHGTSSQYHNEESALRKLAPSKQKITRKRRKPIDNLPTSQNDSILENQAIQDSVLSTTVGKNITENKNDTQEESKYPRRTKRERIPNISKYPLTAETPLSDDTTIRITPGKRRGRPKKASLETTTLSEPDSTNTDSLANENLDLIESNTLEDLSRKNEVKKGRRVKSKIQPSINQCTPNNSSNDIIESETDTSLNSAKKPTRRGRKKISESAEKPIDSIEFLQEPNGERCAQISATNSSKLEENLVSSNVQEDVETLNVDNISNNPGKKSGKQTKKKVNENTTECEIKDTSQLTENIVDLDDDADDICLSKLKENINNITDNLNDFVPADVQNNVSQNGDTTAKRNSKMPMLADFEYNIDKIVKEASLDGQPNTGNNTDESLLIEDNSKRPNRRKTKQNFKYDEGSDEDPFANVELSDDEPRGRKKGRYDYDDEYIPGKKRGMAPVSSSDSDSELNDLEDGNLDGRKQKRKKILISPRKRGRKSKTEQDILTETNLTSTSEPQDGDIESSLKPALITTEGDTLSMKPPAEAWATSNEFENFIAQKIQGTNLKIKKVSSRPKTEPVVAPINIPVLDQMEINKKVEISTQTLSTPTTSTGVQTSVPYDIPMKSVVDLSSEQSQKACEFLNSVVKTTVELGQLMKDKSEDFMKKKINTENVTDTFKMDYCVRKSFLLFKLAKHNLMQMEEDLAKQYDEFLKSNNLSGCREEIKQVAPKPKEDSDSDCEIVDVKEGPSKSTTVKNEKEKPKFNPKTVFLNKELSIKIAKKPSSDKNIDIKGRHTVWINDSVMVKKVKPTQSFLAQDSRNKKPPDYITEKMVSDFFEDYYRQKALAMCAPYINAKWSSVHREYVCNYFIKCNDFDESDTGNTEIGFNLMDSNGSTTNEDYTSTDDSQETYNSYPKTLSALCIEVVHSCLHADNVKEAKEDLLCNFTDGQNKNQPLTLFRLCIQALHHSEQKNITSNKLPIILLEEKLTSVTVLPLKTLCYQKIVDFIPFEDIDNDGNSEINDDTDDVGDDYYYEDRDDSNLKRIMNTFIRKRVSEHKSICQDLDYLSSEDDSEDFRHIHKFPSDSGNNGMQSLLSLCIKSIQSYSGDSNKSNASDNEVETFHSKIQVEERHPEISSPKSLKYIAYENVRYLMCNDENLSSVYPILYNLLCDEKDPSNSNVEDFTINSVNTLSEEAFHRLEVPGNEFQDEDYDYESGIDFDQGDEGENGEDNERGENEEEENEGDGNEWAAQVQMQELRSCVTPVNNTIESESISTNIENDDPSIPYQDILEPAHDNVTLIAQVKMEPLDDALENVVNPAIVKTEPVHCLDGMTIIPESVVSKRELVEHLNDPSELAERESASLDVTSFEQFFRSAKMMRSADECDAEEIFSQSGLRIRRQHEPDHDAENDMNMSLLIPHTYEHLPIENAKGVLMESSSDENKDSAAKKGSKKKLERKKRPQKKGKEVVKNSKEIPPPKKDMSPAKDVPTTLKEKELSVNEVAILTRRMREKIRQEEKKIESSDSETDNIALSLRKDKSKKENEKNKSTKTVDKGETSKDTEKVDSEIQCNNVDSTEQIIENKDNSSEGDKFTGFSAIDQNEISSYQKYMKFVYDKLMPAVDNNIEETTDFNEDNNDYTSPLINPEEPVELLECEPTMPIFDSEVKGKAVKRSKKTLGKKKDKEAPEPSITEKFKPKYTERHGWHCYTIDHTETKLYQNCHIPLEKLPESFVETYLEYHDITEKDNEDKEVDRLINLQTLKRTTSMKEGKSKGRNKGKTPGADQSALEQESGNVSRVPSPALSDRLDELSPSEDEGANVDDELPPPIPLRTTENCIAKTSLMNEHESESDGEGTKKIKQELIEPDHIEPHHPEVKYKPGPKSRTRNATKPAVDPPTAESLMLTADKMMNKELSLLYAPVILKEELKETSSKEPSPKDGAKCKKKQSKTPSTRERLKAEDDSSSEEEKQWVSTKEKLLKRMGKKEDSTADDAKRAKLVDDFIERRGDAAGKRQSHAGGRRRSRKKMLERLKQQRVLSKELYGESSLDVTPGGKRGAASGPFKGRRNIRKVIDKKSLQKSTVLANMEELERKRRLNARQNQLRELLGCEEGVNVLVINDEVCLEYDFEEQRPVVTVHPFFTKVMKAHQYEGVKFMWDACFESLEAVESGRGGGGCILAHCMGLGKTLQVLALLHTVLTHPRACMTRVLVCCPLSTVLNWVDEIHKWIGPVTDQIKVFELSKLKKTYERAYQLEDWYIGGGIFIIGYELFRSLTTLDPLIDEVRPTIINKIRTALLDPGPDIIICDEGHLLKNDCSVLAVAMSRVVTKRRIVLTGTPMQNNLREYYCMVNFVKPNLLGTYSEYSNRFENPIMNGQHRDSREEDIKLMKARTFILHKVLEGCLQRQEASVLYPYLPKKHEYTVFIPLTKCQWDLYKHYVHHYTKKSKQSILKDFHVLQKIWSHPQVLHNFQIKARDSIVKKEIKAEKVEDDLALEDKEDIKPADTEVWWLQYLADGAMLDSVDSSNKFVAVFRILNECVALGDKVLIFSTSLFCLDALEYFLKKINSWSLGQDYYRLDGSVPAEVRQKWCREFNADNNYKTKLFLISTRAGCLGLNMTAANRVIILDTSWNPAHDIQSIFRVYRFGQKKDCYIYRLVAMGTMEQKIYERSVTKQAVSCRVVDEQQIDRHYNMAELTELYKFDELGVGVAGGVAVGIVDVALLRVARDAAVHAVHEHDSLLRGSGEQGLPEHERAAAWTQFQQEHAHKQMQNDLESDQAARALKLLQEEQAMQQLMQQQLLQQQSQVLNIKTEDGPVHDSPLVPRAEQPPPPATRGKGGARGRGRRPTIVKCRIPIKTYDDQPGPSGTVNQEGLVQQISDLLIKFNFTQDRKGPQQIQDLVNRVKKQMVHSGEPFVLENCDELTASIVNVLLRRQETWDRPVPPLAAPPPMPALTDVAPDELLEKRPRRGRPRLPIESAPEQKEPKRGRRRPKKSTAIPEEPIPEPVASPPQETDEIEVGGRRRRKAAIAAERQFDVDDGTSQDSTVEPERQFDVNDGTLQDSEPDVSNSVIELDDDDWQGEPEIEPEPVEKEPEQTGRKKAAPVENTRPDDDSILLSDDEVLAEPPRVAVKMETEKLTLNPSLLTNPNFVKIVAHTYLDGNPMLDEDAATLAAQYSTIKLLKETESSGKPIDSGPIFNIAVQVLGRSVLERLQGKGVTNEDSSIESSAACSKMMQILNKESAEAPASKKRTGLKSKVRQVKEETIHEPREMPKLGIPSANVTQTGRVVPVSLIRRQSAASAAPAPAPAPAHVPPLPPPPTPAPADECILPDDDDVRFVAEPEPPAPPAPTVKFKVSVKKELGAPSDGIRVTAGAAPPDPRAVQSVICLDSDDDEPAPAPAPPPPVQPPAAPPLSKARALRAARQAKAALALAQEQAQRAAPGPPPAPAGGGGPVPVALTGPDSRPIPLAHHLGPPPPAPAPACYPALSSNGTCVTLASEPPPPPLVAYAPTGPIRLPAPVFSIGAEARPVPISLSGPGFDGVPLAPGAPARLGGGPVAVAYVGGGAGAEYPAYRLRLGASAAGVVRSVRMSAAAVAAPAPPGGFVHQVASAVYLVPRAAVGDRLQTRLPPPGLGAAAVSSSVVHTIDDDEPPAAPPASSAAVGAPQRTESPPPQGRSARRNSSSSSSSGSSRSASPAAAAASDPLSILRDVVHIQAPARRERRRLVLSPCPPAAPPDAGPARPPPKAKSSASSTDKRKDEALDQKSNSRSKRSIVDGRTEAGPSTKSATDSRAGAAKFKDSIDLTEVTIDSIEAGDARRSVKCGKVKRAGPTTVTGTSKNIFLDVKSKSLINKSMLNLTGNKNIQVTNVKAIPSSSNPKPVEKKRTAPLPTPDLAPKKKKKELMTLKDFNLDDINDVIELD